MKKSLAFYVWKCSHSLSSSILVCLFLLLSFTREVHAKHFFLRLSSNYEDKQTPPLPTNSAAIGNIAEQVTVRIRAGSSLQNNLSVGSGTIVRRQNSVYTVITAAHIFADRAETYSIQTPDQKNHVIDAPVQFYTGKDLAVVRFRSSATIYQIPDIGLASQLSAGDTIYAAGFPLENRLQTDSRLALRRGEVSLLLGQPLENGYRLAYTSLVDIGMSGGPIFNSLGEVVGINGMRDDPIWDVPSRYENGAFPSPQIQEILERSSLAIVIEDLID